jgi:restriction endonuclease S subunit
VTPLPQGWRWSTLGQIADVVGGVTKDSKRETRSDLVEVPYLRVANVQRGRIDLSQVSTIRVPAQKAAQLELMPGDVLLNEGGDRDKLGRGWVWRGEIPGCIHQNHVFRARVKNDVLDPKLLAWYANEVAHKWFEANGKQSVNLASISLTKIRTFPVPIPPADEQRRIVGLLEDHCSRLDASRSAIARSEARLGRLRQATLAAALQAALVVSGDILSIGEIATVGTGATPLKARREYYDGGTIPWITSADLAQGVISEPTQFITPQALAETNVKLFAPGTVLIAMYGEGKTRGTVGELAIAATTNQACAAIQLHNSEPPHRAWVRLVLEANYWHMRRLASGGCSPI